MGCDIGIGTRDSGFGVRDVRNVWDAFQGRSSCSAAVRSLTEAVWLEAGSWTSRGAGMLTRSQRLQTQLIAAAVSPAISALCRTITWKVEGAEHYDEIVRSGRQPIIAFWHGRILPAAWYFRNRGIVALTSANFDGQWIARVLEHFGNHTVAGSSSRGGMRAMLELKRRLDGGSPVAFALDGPRGPRGSLNRAPPGWRRRQDIRSCRSMPSRVRPGRCRAGTARRCRSHSARWRWLSAHRLSSRTVAVTTASRGTARSLNLLEQAALVRLTRA